MTTISRICRKVRRVWVCGHSSNSAWDLKKHLRALIRLMGEDLPIYSESMLRTRLQFADLERFKHLDATPIWEKSDPLIEQFEGGTNVRRARELVMEPTKSGLLEIHSIVFG